MISLLVTVVVYMYVHLITDSNVVPFTIYEPQVFGSEFSVKSVNDRYCPIKLL